MSDDNKDQFYSWLQTLLKDKGWQIARSGTKVLQFNEKHRISNKNGYWANPAYSGSKPPRWIINFKTATEGIQAWVPHEHRAERIGQGNTAQGNVVGISVRIIPTFQVSDGKYLYVGPWEWNLLFLTPYPLSIGSSSETFDYQVGDGQLIYKDEPVGYIFAALMGLTDPGGTETIEGVNVSYGQATAALQRLLHVKPIGQMLSQVRVFDLGPGNGVDLAEMKRAIQSAIATATSLYTARLSSTEGTVEENSEDYRTEDESGQGISEITKNQDLIGIDPTVYRQINAALKSGKQHLMLYGPPGTGKTTLARWIGAQLAGGKWNLITGSADWSSQDIIGGYQPVGDGRVAFIPGILLKTFDQPLIIDELNRCDIDKVLGPLFTVLSGHYTALPYRINIEDPQSPAYVILPSPKSTAEPHEFAPGDHWRLIATINSIDKASLYQMSYALSRRFGWIYIDAPQDKKAFLIEFFKDVLDTAVDNTNDCPLALIWDNVNQVRVLGPAPFIDMVAAILAMDEEANFFERPSDKMKAYLLDAFEMFVLPLMDGISRLDADRLSGEIAGRLEIVDSLMVRLSNRLLSVAV